MPGEETKKEDETGGRNGPAVIAVAHSPAQKNVHSISLNTKY